MDHTTQQDQRLPLTGNPKSVATSPSSENEENKAPVGKRWRFWAVFAAVCFTTLLAAIESTVTSTALPFISHALDAGDSYIWFANAYFLTSTALLPLLGQLCNLFGRRWMMLIVVALFALGSGISGGAKNTANLIGGRAVQGIGGGGINLLIELIVSDLVPLRERGAYFGIVFGVFSLGTAVGPLVGGAIVDGTTWRWVFWINLPVAGVALVLHFLFLHVNYDREAAILTKLKRIDYAGNAILVASVVAVLLALSWGGTKYPWSSYQVLVPLIVGIFGLVLFHMYEGMPWVREYPTLPERVFKRRTPAIALIIACINFICLFWVIYFLPVYLQAVLGMSPTLSGVALLPTVLLSVVTGAISSVLPSKWGRYRPLYILAFGVSVPAAIFNAQFANLSWRIGDADIQKQLSGGNAYSFANADYVRNFPEPQRDRVIDVYAQSLKLTWQFSLGFALLGFLLCFLQKEISLRSTIDAEFGLGQKKQGTDPEGNSEKEPGAPSA
ncbi:major facilitator superfamily domain-containing protein [Xylaria castorea]|nr:major facilitator superfamily domain-containing protein [Xylaria castorea]